MPRYELKFIVAADTLSDAVVDALGETEDVLCGGTGFGDGFVTITVSAASAQEAMMNGWARLQNHGLQVLDIQRDLVSASEIAARTGQSRQAIHHWIKGKRRSGFPRPFDPVNGLWLWGEVQKWALIANVPVDDDGMAYPSRLDHDWAGLSLARDSRAPATAS